MFLYLTAVLFTCTGNATTLMVLGPDMSKSCSRHASLLRIRQNKGWTLCTCHDWFPGPSFIRRSRKSFLFQSSVLPFVEFFFNVMQGCARTYNMLHYFIGRTCKSCKVYHYVALLACRVWSWQGHHPGLDTGLPTDCNFNQRVESMICCVSLQTCNRNISCLYV